MKIILLLFILVVGCSKDNRLDELESRLYGIDEVFVAMEQNEVNDIFGIKNSDYDDFIALETLVVYDRKQIFVFYNASDFLKGQIVLLNIKNHVVLEMDSYLYYGVDDSRVLDIVKEILNK